MKKFLFALRGCLVISLIALVTIPTALAIIIIGVIAKIVPIKCWNYYGMKAALKCPMIWIDLFTLIMKINSSGKWDVQGPEALKKDGCYILVSNHASWVDILILLSQFNHKIPVIKFFIKKELKWALPFAGLACWVLDFPFMERHSRAQIKKNPSLKGKDIKTTRVACRKLKEHPTTLVNFAEGTRFTSTKHARQNSPYKNLLKPKAGGLAIAVEELNTHITGIIDNTICFTGGEITFWKFATGNFSKLFIRYRVIPVSDNLVGNYYKDRQFRADFQTWLNNIWYEKDNLITELKEQHG